MTQKEIADLYEEHVDTLRSIVWDFIRQLKMRPSNFDELFSQSNLYFMLAMKNYEPNCSKFNTWLYPQVWGRLMTTFKEEQRELGLRERLLMSADFGHSHTSADFRDVDWNDELSRDAKYLVRLVRMGILDLEVMLKYRGNGLRKTFRLLRNHGWSRKRVHRCFKNLKRLLD